jgi:hypothetical protein
MISPTLLSPGSRTLCLHQLVIVALFGGMLVKIGAGELLCCDVPGTCALAADVAPYKPILSLGASLRDFQDQGTHAYAERESGGASSR